MKNKTYYLKLDIIRVIACLLVLFYHLNILKGGFLAVSIFFVLTSYLACLSAFKKDNFSIIEYYKNRFFKLYLPLIIVIFITLGIISLIPSINFFNLKPEVNSILFGYNNFWQLKANLDYFARHVDSPFMHLWYIAILIQFDLLFPFIFKLLKKLGDKIHQSIPIIIPSILSIISFIFFYLTSKNNLMFSYYHTLTRSFSLLMGIALAFYHQYYFKELSSKAKLYQDYIFYFYIIIIMILSIFMKSNSNLMPLAMLLVSLISLRLITYSLKSDDDLTWQKKVIKYLASISYEVYLVQYPLIFLIPFLNLNNILTNLLIIILTFLIGAIFHFCLDLKNKNYHKLKIMGIILLTLGSIYGLIIYVKAKDHTEEMQDLEELLNQNEELLLAKQKEYADKMAEEEESWQSTIDEFEAANGDISSLVANLHLVGIGDSVMLGAVPNLYKEFTNGYFDAKVSRTAWSVQEILNDLKNQKLLGDPIIFHLGTNGDCSESCKVKIMEACEGKEVFWLTTTYTKQASFNTKIREFKDKYQYDNLHIIDWEQISKGHPEYFAADGIHLTGKGRVFYTNTLHDALYNFYYEEYQQRKNDLIKDHEENKKNNITFYGNDLMLNLYPYIENDYKENIFDIKKDYDYLTLKENIIKQIDNNTLTNTIVILMDNLEKEEYNDIINILKDYNVIIVLTKKIELISNENIKIINFYENIENNKDYLLLDGKHLSEKGNKALKEVLDGILKSHE